MVSWDSSIVSALVCGVVLVCVDGLFQGGCRCRWGFCGLSLVGGLVDRLCVGGDGLLVCV